MTGALLIATNVFGGAPIESTFRGFVPDVSNGPTYNFSVPASVPDNCLMVVCCGTEGSAPITGLSGGGYTWTEVTSTGVVSNTESSIFVAEVTTAPTSVSMTTGTSGFRAGASFYSIINHSSATPVNTQQSGVSGTSTSVTLTSIQEGDAMIAFCTHSQVGSMTWTGVTEEFDSTTSENNSTFSGGSATTGAVTSQAISATFSGSSQNMALVAAAFR